MLSRTRCTWRTASRAAPRQPSSRAAGASTWRRCWLVILADCRRWCVVPRVLRAPSHLAVRPGCRAGLWGRAAWHANGRQPPQYYSQHRWRSGHRRTLLWGRAVGPGCLACRRAVARPLAVRAASFARSVVSKPGQALPPPTGTATRPRMISGIATLPHGYSRPLRHPPHQRHLGS